jgi:hypothetical protein
LYRDGTDRAGIISRPANFCARVDKVYEADLIDKPHKPYQPHQPIYAQNLTV